MKITMIRKHIAPVLLLLLFAYGCTPKIAEKTQSSASERNVEVEDVYGGSILLGAIDRDGLEQEGYASWFTAGYEAYTPQTKVVEQLQGKFDNKRFLVFLGTWCSDSQREVPHFFKILDQLGVEERQVTMYAVTNDPDHYNTTPQGYEDGWNIEYVPTFIVLQDGEELGRIIEASYPSLEENLLDIVQ